MSFKNLADTSADKNNSGIYIHYPFCKARCPYCGFKSSTAHEWTSLYLECLLAEIERAVPFFEKSFTGADTLYFGGGTPSLMHPHMLDEILASLRRFPYFSGSGEKPEITLEANPENLKEEYLKTIRSIGVNRLSIGAQRFNDDLLQNLGRGHRTEDTVSAFEYARKAGFKNISIDFIIGIPGEKGVRSVKEIKKILALKPEHISVYMLEIKEHTPFAALDPKLFPEENYTADLYLETVDLIAEAGYEQYEISNFALPSFESRHNLKYWSGGSWLGLGLSAASFNPEARWTNPGDFSEYTKWIASDDYRIPPANAEFDKRKLAEEAFFMGMRKTRGVNLEEFKSFWDYDPSEKIKDDLSSFIESGLMIINDPPGNIKFTLKGFLVSNEILCRMIS